MTITHYPNADIALRTLARYVTGHGALVPSRQGEPTQEALFEDFALDRPWEREVTSSVRRASVFAQIAETMWMFAGRDDIAWLSNYLPRAADFSDDGRTWRGAYGRRLRAWPKGDGSDDYVDQLAHVVELLRTDPTTRRAVLSIYDPARDTDPGKDIPCNDLLQFIWRNGRLNLHVFTRSNDLIWGWSGVNAFEWSALLEVVSELLKCDIGEIHFSITSLHIYEKHWERAASIGAEPDWDRGEKSPAFAFAGGVEAFDDLVEQWFSLEEKIRNGEDVFEEIAAFPEPMFRSWLQVIAYYWANNPELLGGLEGTALAKAARISPKRKATKTDEFASYVSTLHAEKHAAYGDSWKRRGEQMGIMANIARKVDRLGVSGAGDTATDTAVDLCVYLFKYGHWLIGSPNDEVAEVTALAFAHGKRYVSSGVPFGRMEGELSGLFFELEGVFSGPDRYLLSKKLHLIDRMATIAFELAYQRWTQDNK